MHDKVLIIDFGAQYTQLIARRVREMNVYCEIHPYDDAKSTLDAWAAEKSLRGVILSGGPNSVTEASTPRAPHEVFEAGVPVLGICYGMQTMAAQLGGAVEGGHVREFGFARVRARGHTKLLDGIEDTRSPEGHGLLEVWMSHGNKVVEMPKGFGLMASTEHCPIAGRADEARSQTVLPRQPGAVAAHTAGLHFDEALLAKLSAGGVDIAWLTLHVGAGTFQPVRVQQLTEHRMHAERFEIPPATIAAIARTRARGGRVVAVGTTSLRALEAAAQHGELQPGPAETDIFITPGYEFRVVDRLVTNFHLPKSTLLMLVSAFAGIDTIRGAYRHAISQRYRFFSYGDAMLLTREPGSAPTTS